MFWPFFLNKLQTSSMVHTENRRKQWSEFAARKKAQMTPEELAVFVAKKKEYDRAYRVANREHRKALNQSPKYVEWNKKHKKEFYKNVRKIREGRKDRVPAAPVEIQKQRIRESCRRCRVRAMKDPINRMVFNTRKAIGYHLNSRGRKKRHSTMTYIGCSGIELMAHLEKQFKPGMTWENYGPVWWIDHLRPVTTFNLLDEGEQRKCFHYTNLQPMFKIENIKKGNRYSSLPPDYFASKSTVNN
jgi:hypothetical protein